MGLSIVSTGTVCSSLPSFHGVLLLSLPITTSEDEKPSKDHIEVTQHLIKTGLIVGNELWDLLSSPTRKGIRFKKITLFMVILILAVNRNFSNFYSL